MAEERFFRFGPIALTNTLTTNLLSPASATGGVGASGLERYIELHHISIINKTGSAATFSLFLGATGANAAGTEIIGSGLSVPANDRHEWYGQLRIDEGRFLVGGASANTTLTIMGEGVMGVGPSTSVVAISNQTAGHNNIGGTATANYRLNSAGTAERSQSSGGGYVSIPGEWLVRGTNSDFEARLTHSSGDNIVTGPSGWNALSTTRTWTATTSTPTNSLGTYTLEIRRASDGLVLDTASIIFETNTA